MSVDSVGDFLTIIRNGVLASKGSVTAQHSRLKQGIATILKDEGFIKDVVVEDMENNKKQIKIMLKYVGGESVIHEINRVSKLSCRSYSGHSLLKPVIGNLGISILTTNKGLMTNKQARQQGVGGEVLCTVW